MPSVAALACSTGIEPESATYGDAPSPPSPEEIAEAREAAAIGREALQMLPDRDRLIFRRRHQMNLSPEEIVRATPGLSPRTYRKIIQRANARALEAFERIRDGERCEEMRDGLLRRYIAEESPEPERRAIKAHLAHCRACRREQARMRGFLSNVAGAPLAVSLAGPSRGPRERARDVLLRLAAGLPGQGGDAMAGQGLSTSALKVASVCAGVAASTCIATGVVPGIGLLHPYVRAEKPQAQGASHRVRPIQHPTFIDTLPDREAAGPSPKSRRTHSRRRQPDEPSKSRTRPSTAPARPVPMGSHLASKAAISGRQVGTEVGAESAGQPMPSSRTSAPLTSDGESGMERPAESGSSDKPAASSEFGM